MKRTYVQNAIAGILLAIGLISSSSGIRNISSRDATIDGIGIETIADGRIIDPIGIGIQIIADGRES